MCAVLSFSSSRCLSNLDALFLFFSLLRFDSFLSCHSPCLQLAPRIFSLLLAVHVLKTRWNFLCAPQEESFNCPILHQLIVPLLYGLILQVRKFACCFSQESLGNRKLATLQLLQCSFFALHVGVVLDLAASRSACRVRRAHHFIQFLLYPSFAVSRICACDISVGASQCSTSQSLDDAALLRPTCRTYLLPLCWLLLELLIVRSFALALEIFQHFSPCRCCLRLMYSLFFGSVHKNVASPFPLLMAFLVAVHRLVLPKELASASLSRTFCEKDSIHCLTFFHAFLLLMYDLVSCLRGLLFLVQLVLISPICLLYAILTLIPSGFPSCIFCRPARIRRSAVDVYRLVLGSASSGPSTPFPF